AGSAGGVMPAPAHSVQGDRLRGGRGAGGDAGVGTGQKRRAGGRGLGGTRNPGSAGGKGIVTLFRQESDTSKLGFSTGRAWPARMIVEAGKRQVRREGAQM